MSEVREHGEAGMLVNLKVHYREKPTGAISSQLPRKTQDNSGVCVFLCNAPVFLMLKKQFLEITPDRSIQTAFYKIASHGLPYTYTPPNFAFKKI